MVPRWHTAWVAVCQRALLSEEPSPCSPRATLPSSWPQLAYAPPGLAWTRKAPASGLDCSVPGCPRTMARCGRILRTPRTMPQLVRHCHTGAPVFALQAGTRYQCKAASPQKSAGQEEPYTAGLTMQAAEASNRPIPLQPFGQVLVQLQKDFDQVLSVGGA